MSGVPTLKVRYLLLIFIFGKILSALGLFLRQGTKETDNLRDLVLLVVLKVIHSGKVSEKFCLALVHTNRKSNLPVLQAL
jgi:hypothetical protein